MLVLRAVLSRRVVLAAAMLFAMPISAVADLRVRFEHPRQFADAANTYGAAEPRLMRIIEQHLQELGRRCLPPSAALEIRITDIDLAGRFNGMQVRGMSAIRVMDDTTWPSMGVTYVLAVTGRQPVEARERISDVNYLRNSYRARYDTQPLPYERAMLTSWFESRFCRA